MDIIDEFVDISKKWQSEYQYRTISYKKWKELYNKLPSDIKNKISSTPKGLYHNTQYEYQDLLSGDIKLMSFTNERTADFFNRQRGGMVIPADLLQKYSIAISYRKMSKLFDVGDDEDEVVVFDPVISRPKLKKYVLDELSSSYEFIKDEIIKDHRKDVYRKYMWRYRDLLEKYRRGLGNSSVEVIISIIIGEINDMKTDERLDAGIKNLRDYIKKIISAYDLHLYGGLTSILIDMLADTSKVISELKKPHNWTTGIEDSHLHRYYMSVINNI